MDERLQRLADEAEIRSVITRYCHALDRGTADEVADLFHPEGTLMLGFEDGRRHSGREQIRQWFVDYHANYRARLSFLRHCVSSVRIDVDGDRAQAVSFLDADCTPRDDPKQLLRVVGRYDDRFAREGGVWLLAERSIVVNWSDERMLELLHDYASAASAVRSAGSG